MTALFGEGRPIEPRSICEWGKLVAAADSNIRLPPFQRSSEWEERRVELLWDSLMRGIPIGALLFARPIVAIASKSLADTPGDKSKRLEHYAAPILLIDGQQRLTALRIGFQPFADEHNGRLWIDLATPSTKEGKKRGQFRFCSRVHPWGWGAPVAARRKSRELIGYGDRIDDINLPLRKTWPLDARAPVDAFELIKRALASDVLPAWADLLPPHLPLDDLVRTEIPGNLAAIVDGLRRLNKRILVGLLVDTADAEALGEAFSRLNSQGIPMSQEELFFSALKLKWPESSDLVADIVEDPDAGRVLTATKIVHLATRIALSESGAMRSDIDWLNLYAFKELESNSEVDLVSNLGLLIGRGANGETGRIHTAMVAAREILQYRATPQQSDPGLPRTMLGSLHWRSWHTLAAWADRHSLKAEEIDEESRLEALRLVVLLHFFVGTGKSYVAREAFKQARIKTSRRFPGALIAAALLRERLVTEPLDPMQFRAWLANVKDGNEQATGPFLVNEQHLLHWAQRHWLHRWYPEHDPTLYRSVDDLPYDVDHIMPSHAFDGRGGGTRCPEFERDATALRSSVGNLRIWPREANRSNQDAKPAAKLFLECGQEVPLRDEPLLRGKPCEFNTAGDVRRASIVDEDQRDFWLYTSHKSDQKNWASPERALALRKAVDERRARLYELLWRGVGFDIWWPDVLRLSETSSASV